MEFKEWVHCQGPKIVGKTFQLRQHQEERQSYNMMDSLQTSEYLRLAKGKQRPGETLRQI